MRDGSFVKNDVGCGAGAHRGRPQRAPWATGMMRAGRAALALLVCTGSALAASDAQPQAFWGDVLLRPGSASAATRDLAIRRDLDGLTRVFVFDRAGRRDAAAIAAFLHGTTGRVSRVFDQVGGHDLVVPPGAVGPLVDPRSTTAGLPGLLFDNGGAFEGNPAADGRPYRAVALRATGLDLDPAKGVALVAGLRLGNVASIAAAPLLAIDSNGKPPLVLLAGHPAPGRRGGDDRMSVAAWTLAPLGLPPPSTPSVLALTTDAAGIRMLCDGRLGTAAIPTGGRREDGDLLLGSTLAGGGAGWELDTLAVHARPLSPAALAAAAARARPTGPQATGVPTIVLDGDSIDAGVGSVALRNLTRLYESRLPTARIFNVAVGGATMADRLDALPGTLELLRHRDGPTLLLGAAGANSLARGVPATEAYREASAYVAAAHASLPGLHVGLATLIPMGTAIDAGREEAFATFNRLVKANAAHADFIADRASDRVMGDPATIRPVLLRRFSTDGVHPSEEGYERLARIDAEALAAAIAPPRLTR